MGSEGNFKSTDFAMRAQKKILGQFASRKAAKMFINENLSNLLDLLYQLIKTHTKDKKIAEKFVKNIIKLSIKFGVLAQNEVFSQDEIRAANKFADNFRHIVMTITSFIEVDFTYDQKYLLNAVEDCVKDIASLIRPHLTEKTVERVESVGKILGTPELLDCTFKKGSPENDIMLKMVVVINKAIESGEL